MTYNLRPQQTEVLEWCKAAIKRGMNYLIVEAPTGSGKSIISKELTRMLGDSYVLVPFVSLQQQYSEFENCSPLLGRSRFPCLVSDRSAALRSIPIVRQGQVPVRPVMEQSCAGAICLGKPRAKAEAIREQCGENCPHQVSIDVAQESRMVAANFHSYIYNVSLGTRLNHRRVMILDEAHLAAETIRGFMTTKFMIRRKVFKAEIDHLKTTEQWCQWLSLPEQLRLLKNEENKDSYLQRLEKLKTVGESVFKHWEDENGRFWIEFVPCYIGGAFRRLLADYADIIVFMSGSILKTDLFCQELGIRIEQVAVMKLPSTFPKENRKVYLPRDTTIDLSYKNQGRDFKKAVAEVRRIMIEYPDVKGIIQCSSYKMMRELDEELNSPRLIIHESETFHDKLREFKETDLPVVFASCNIVEGLDFANDLARFQIIMTPQYPPASEPYAKWLINKGRWDLYRYNASKTLVQQCGRGVRSEVDYCDTFLLDGRFVKFLKDTWGYYPQWFKDGIQR